MIIKKIIDNIKRIHDKYILPINFQYGAALSFYAVTSIIPCISLLYFFIKGLNVEMQIIEEFLELIFSDNLAHEIVIFLSYSSDAFSFSRIVLFVVSLWLISDGLFEFIKYINEKFGFKSKSFILLRLRAFVLGLIMILSTAILTVLFVALFSDLADLLDSVFSNILMFGIYFLLGYLSLLILTYLSSLQKIKFKALNKGLLVFALAFSCLLTFFMVYINVFTDMSGMHGPLSGFASLLLFMFFFSIILLFSINIILINHKLIKNS